MSLCMFTVSWDHLLPIIVSNITVIGLAREVCHALTRALVS